MKEVKLETFLDQNTFFRRNDGTEVIFFYIVVKVSLKQKTKIINFPFFTCGENKLNLLKT